MRDPDRLARKPRRAAGRDRDRRLLHELSRPAGRPVHGGRHGGAAVSGPRRAAPHRDLHRPSGPGFGRRRPRAAAQRAGEPGHRLGDDSGGPARLRLTARPALGRGRPAAARGVRHPVQGCAPDDPADLGGGEVRGDRAVPGGYARSPRYRGLRPGRGRCQAAHQGGPVPAVPGLRAEPDDYPASAGRARGLRHHASGLGRGRRTRDRGGGNGGTVPRRAAGLPDAARDSAVGHGRRRDQRRRARRPVPPVADPAPGPHRSRRDQR